VLKAGQKIPPGSLLEIWLSIGYQPVDTVLEPGQFSHRGGLLDVWPQSEQHPIRLDFFGDEIDALRRFDPASQRTIEKMGSILITPAREYILGEEDRSRLSEFSEFHIPILLSMPSSLLDYLPQKSLVLVDDLSILENAGDEIEEQAVKLRNESISEGTLAVDFPVPYISWSELEDGFQSYTFLELGHSTAEESSSNLASHFSQIERFGGRLKPFIEYLATTIGEKESVVIVSRQASRLEELWAEQGSGSFDRVPGNPQFLEASLSEGWKLTSDFQISNYLITDSEIFGWERPQPRQRPHPGAETPESAYADLHPGDWIVHVDYGIGRYVGLVQRTLEGLGREFLCIEYKNGDQVYVPIHQADRLTRYIGPDGSPPAPGSLGTQEWPETKRKVREAVQEVAQELLDLYARRQIAEGFAFSPDNPWQGELESSFPYVETDDQVKALIDIKRDMEKPRPMDRLLCGEIGRAHV
jgi:transcription-repair coupling factor (superfamily II helicase)